MNLMRLLIFLSFINTTAPIFGLLDILRFGSEQVTSGKLPSQSNLNDKQQQIAVLQADIEEQKSLNEERERTSKSRLAEIDQALTHIKEQKKQATLASVDFLSKQEALLNEARQLLLNTHIETMHALAPLERTAALLQDSLRDPNFISLELPDRSFFTYQDFESSSKKVLAQEEKLRHLQEQHQEILAEQESIQQKLVSTTKEYDAKKKEQQNFLNKANSTTSISNDLTVKEQGILLDLQKNLLGHEKKFIKLKLDVLRRKLIFISTSIALEQERLKILKNNLEKIRRGLRIDQNDIQEAKAQLEEQKKETLTRQEELYNAIQELTQQKEVLIHHLDKAKKKYQDEGLHVSTIEWSSVPKNSEHIIQLCEIGAYKEPLKLIEEKIDYNNALIDLEKIKFQDEKIEIDILFSWADLLKRKGKSGDPAIELKRYQSFLSEIERKVAAFKEKRNAASHNLDLVHKDLNYVTNIKQEFILHPTTIKLRTAENSLCSTQLTTIEENIKKRIEVLGNLLPTYASIIDLLQTTIHRLTTIISELEKKSIWQRSEYAISASGIRNIASDLDYFIHDVYALLRAYFSMVSISHVKSIVYSVTHSQERLFVWLLYIFTIFLLLFVTRKFLIRLKRFLLVPSPAYKRTTLLRSAAAACIDFIYQHSFGLCIWLIFFVLIGGEVIDELILEITFYLISMIYLFYLTTSFTHHIIAWNERNNNIFFSPPYQRRFNLVVSIFGYTTAILLFTREAFIAAMYYTSELPTILLACYSIIIRTLLIFSIGRDELVNMLPTRGFFWPAVSRFISNYYYPILVVIILLMILSDPYVGGYGNLVSYFLWGTIGTIVLIKLLFMLQVYIKQAATHLFMYTDDETPRERFSHARSWYGIFVVILSIIFLAIGVILALYIWGHALSWHDIEQWLDVKLFSTGIENGERIWFTPHKFLVVLGFILGGFAAAVIVNRFIIARIFQLLPVDLGIQHMITSLTRYLVLMIAIFIGFQWAGLGTLLIAIGLVIGSITYLIREPLADFLSYFIILIQRPVKIGDLVMIGEDVGFIRHITPRSLILRSKNSYTLIIPNSTVIAQPLKNWNYTRGYVAFDDIIITIPYDQDPVKAKKIIMGVLGAYPSLLKIPAPIIRLDNFGINGYEFLVRGFVSSDKTADIWDIASDIRLNLVQALAENGIIIAVATRTILSTLGSSAIKPSHLNEFTQLFSPDKED